MKISSSMNGLSSMKFLLNGLILTIMSLFPTLNPAQTATGETGEQYLDAEFLDFLSEWETETGEWVGPEQFADDSFEQLFDDQDNAATETEGVENVE